VNAGIVKGNAENTNSTPRPVESGRLRTEALNHFLAADWILTLSERQFHYHWKLPNFTAKR